MLGLTRIRLVVAEIWRVSANEWTQIRSDLVPDLSVDTLGTFRVDSTESLTSFNLFYCLLGLEENELDPSHLIDFHNLEHLKLNPFLEESCWAITEAALTLTSLDLLYSRLKVFDFSRACPSNLIPPFMMITNSTKKLPTRSF
jgi:hypothetical protein